jgi:hypothetical protein
MEVIEMETVTETGINWELLEQVVKHAEEEPRRFNMETWYTDAADYVKGNVEFEEFNGEHDFKLNGPEELPPCATIGCLAGSACILSGEAPVHFTETYKGVTIVHYDPPSGGWFENGQRVLGLTYEQAQRLFYPSKSFVQQIGGTQQHWPEPFASQYETALTPETRVAALRARVEHFKATNGAE